MWTAWTNTVRVLVVVVHVSIAGKLLEMLGHPVWSTWSMLKRNVTPTQVATRGEEVFRFLMILIVPNGSSTPSPRGTAMRIPRLVRIRSLVDRGANRLRMGRRKIDLPGSLRVNHEKRHVPCIGSGAFSRIAPGRGYSTATMVTRLDRLARSTVDLLTIIKTIADKGCLFKSLADPWADTTSASGRLMLTVLGGLAEFERSLILARTSEGRDRAIRAGIRMGRKPKLSSHQMAEVRDRKTAGESTRALARSYGVSPNTISRVR